MRRRRPASTIRPVSVTALVVLSEVALSTVSFAASPSPRAAPPFDPRGGGEPPGFTGGPVEVLLLVVLLGVIVAVVTAAAVRLTRTGGDT